jgi:hypothetical protein
MSGPNIEDSIENVIKNADKKSMLEHLQAPRRKRRNYVFVAFGSDVDSGLQVKIEQFVNLNFPIMTVYPVPTIDDLEKLVNKQVNLLIVSDGFAPINKIMPLIKHFKETNTQTGVPTLFLTRDEATLISRYHDDLAPYQESDDYLNLSHMTEKHLLTKVHERLNPKLPARRARRFPVNLKVRYSDLRTGKMFSGVIEDLSAYGCLLAKEPSSPQFTKFDQLRIYIPIDGYLPKHLGDSIAFYGRTSRVLLGGDRTGLAWSQLSEDKHAVLFKILSDMISRRLTDSSLREKNAEAIRKKNLK